MPPNLTHRLDPTLLPELMDEPCPYETLRDTLRDLAQLNRLLRAYNPALHFLQQALPEQLTTPTTILDIGSGGGDTLRRIAQWAHRHNHAVQLTGIDLNPNATRAAREFSANNPLYADIHWLTADALTHPATQTPSLVISSLTTHHLPDDEIIRLLRWMETHATRGWFISDLLRSPRSYRLFRPLSRLMRWHPFIRHDGLVSIRRAFREPDWLRLLTAAEIPAHTVTLRRCAIGRLCLTRLRESPPPAPFTPTGNATLPRPAQSHS